jgi:hypothetical protein
MMPKRDRRPIAVFLCILLLISTLPSCTDREQHASCRAVLEAMMQAELSLPAGKIYHMKTDGKKNEHLSKALICALLPGDSMLGVTEDWLDCAVFLPSSDHPCEFFVVLCQNRDAAEDTALLLGARLATIKRAKEDRGGMLESAKVVIYGNYVLLIISADSENALRSAKAEMRSRSQN